MSSSHQVMFLPSFIITTRTCPHVKVQVDKTVRCPPSNPFSAPHFFPANCKSPHTLLDEGNTLAGPSGRDLKRAKCSYSVLIACVHLLEACRTCLQHISLSSRHSLKQPPPANHVHLGRICTTCEGQRTILVSAENINRMPILHVHLVPIAGEKERAS